MSVSGSTKIDNRAIIKLKRDSVEPPPYSHLDQTVTSLFRSLFSAKRPYIFLQKSLVNAVTHECGSPPHFKIISGKLFLQISPHEYGHLFEIYKIEMPVTFISMSLTE